MKKLIYIVGVAAVVLIAFSLFNNYIYNEKQAGGKVTDLSRYFQDKLTTVTPGQPMPIEGYDANLLISAYPGFEPSDFDGVKTLEGHYEVENGEITFVRDQEQPISSAERTVSAEGYATLLENVSARLEFPTMDEGDVDDLIEQINTADHIMTRIDEGASAFGVKVIPLEVVEDSRCPIDVECVQAGTVRVRATLESGIGTGTAEQIFELDQPITTEAEEITLTQVTPAPESEVEIEESEYVFYFEVRKRE